MQQLDLADLSSVEKLAKHLNLEPQIDLLILNAGVMMCPEDVTKNNFEMQVGTNHFGHFQLTRLLLKKLMQQAGLSTSISKQLLMSARCLHACLIQHLIAAIGSHTVKTQLPRPASGPD